MRRLTHAPRRLTLAIAVGLATALLPTADGAAAAPPLPTRVAALGDSISAGWGSGTDSAGHNIPGVNLADSWSTGYASEVGSHYLRLEAELPPSGSIAAINLSQPGVSIADAMSGFAAEAREVPLGTGYVLFGGGTADACVPVRPSQLLPPEQFAAAFRAGLLVLRARLPGARVFVASIPDWYELWQNEALRDRPRPSYACPLLFGPHATAETAAAVGQAIRAYNAALGRVCWSVEFLGMCDYDGGAAYRLVLTPRELSSVDWFHFSAFGQARLAAATWGKSPYG